MKKTGYTLVELMVAIGLFGFVMTITAGAYLLMININRQTQGLASGINNLSFALEGMARSVRTGSSYNCGGTGDCLSGASTFSFTDSSGNPVTYALGTQTDELGALVGTITADGVALTVPSVNVTGLTFYASGTSSSDELAPSVTMSVSGTVNVGPGNTQSFTVETRAVMRGSDIGP